MSLRLLWVMLRWILRKAHSSSFVRKVQRKGKEDVWKIHLSKLRYTATFRNVCDWVFQSVFWLEHGWSCWTCLSVFIGLMCQWKWAYVFDHTPLRVPIHVCVITSAWKKVWLHCKGSICTDVDVSAAWLRSSLQCWHVTSYIQMSVLILSKLEGMGFYVCLGSM